MIICGLLIQWVSTIQIAVNVLYKTDISYIVAVSSVDIADYQPAASHWKRYAIVLYWVHIDDDMHILYR